MTEVTDGPILQMMLDIVWARIRTSVERFGITPDFTTFPESFKAALEEEMGEPQKKITILGVKIEWRKAR